MLKIANDCVQKLPEQGIDRTTANHLGSYFPGAVGGGGFILRKFSAPSNDISHAHQLSTNTIMLRTLAHALVMTVLCNDSSMQGITNGLLQEATGWSTTSQPYASALYLLLWSSFRDRAE